MKSPTYLKWPYRAVPTVTAINRLSKHLPVMAGADGIAGGVDGILGGIAMLSTPCLGDTNGPATGGGTGSWREGNLSAAEGFRDGSSSESSSEKKRGVALFIHKCHNLNNKLPRIV